MRGSCTCGATSFEMTRDPIVTHACHCTWCQRENGSAFALHAYVETSAVELLSGKIEEQILPTNSGLGQIVARCAHCGTTLWSHFANSGRALAFVRVGTFDEPGAYPPDIHIFVESKQPWVVLPDDARAFKGFYEPKYEWSAEALARFVRAKIDAAHDGAAA